MTKTIKIISTEKSQYLVFLGLSIPALGLSGIIYFTNNQPFQRFIGGINPLMAGIFIILLGAILFAVLLSHGWFAIYKKENLKGLFRRSGLASLLTVIMILLDLKIVYPADMNILFPVSLLFYPAIGFFVEILFHVLPLTMLFILLTSILKDARYEKIVWICIFIISLLEPIYQISWMADRYPLWVVAYVGLHVYLINLFQLIIFKRYDFISMYSFRLVYYLFWHIVWGYFRLKLLF